jgi:hypothetical protein
VPENVGSQVRDLREVVRWEVSPYGDILSPYGHGRQMGRVLLVGRLRLKNYGLRCAVHGHRLTACADGRGDDRSP